MTFCTNRFFLANSLFEKKRLSGCMEYLSLEDCKTTKDITFIVVVTIVISSYFLKHLKMFYYGSYCYRHCKNTRLLTNFVVIYCSAL